MTDYNTPNCIPFILKWEGSKTTGSPLLVFPTYSTNRGMIRVYAHMGQHSEACIAYYRGLKNVPATPHAINLTNALIREYKGFLEDGEKLVRVMRDTKKYQAERYANAR